MRFNRSVRQLEAAIRLQTSLVEVTSVVCGSPSAPAGGEEWNDLPQVVLPRRGVFMLHRDRESALADPVSALVFGADQHYRVSHPVDGGDECLTLMFRPELHEDALGSLGGSAGLVSPRTQLGAAVLASAIGRADADVLACEEAALIVLERLASDLGGGGKPRLSERQRKRADDVRALLADKPDRRWSLGQIGHAVHCSPFHLARQFRLATGETLSRYLLRLRLAAALQRMAGGERDLARVATELGFSHHSHFTARFRSVFGCAPSCARRALVGPCRQELSTILTADPPARS